MRFSIKTKLIAIFMLLLAFMTISMTVAIVGLNRLDQRINHLVDRSAGQVRTTLEAIESLNDGMRELKNLLLATDKADMEQSEKHFLAARVSFQKGIDELHKVADEQMRKMLAPVESQFAAVKISQDKVITLGQVRSNSQAYKMLTSESIPARDTAVGALAPLFAKRLRSERHRRMCAQPNACASLPPCGRKSWLIYATA